MKINDTAINGVYVVETSQNQDSRGAFSRLFCQNELAEILGKRPILQINRSITASVGAIRGMHFQVQPFAEMKLIRCLTGRVFDVAVDLRADSSTFLQWHAQELSGENIKMMVIPEGCAHGFQVLEAESEMLYLHTAFYHAASEGGVRFDDPALAIKWPLPLTDISQRDQQHELITKDFKGIRL
ncbi:MAG: dTDP-4-keto-6-deoxy-D-glucose epimerase [Erysipelotrichia bacterium]|nr:dTDP-4-keto-6-deoxy-D-glucose epimerase [Erysipelotrichia bacterium]